MKHTKKISLLIFGILLLILPFGIAEAATADIALGSVELVQDTFEYTGEEIHPEFTVYDEFGNLVFPENYTCEYVGAVKAGNENTKLYIKAKEDSGYKGSLKKQFFITPVPLDKVTASAIPDQIYAASSIKPLPEITYKGKALTKGTDYTLTYKDNKYAGTATVIITGSATFSEDKKNKNFSGEKTVTFKINPLSFESGYIEAIDDKTYTGSAITPGVILMFGGQRLSSARYKLTYKNNVNAGTATVTATGVGDYCGTLTATFKITPIQSTPGITLSQTSFEYDGTAKKPEVKSVTYGESRIPIDSSNYTVSYSSGCTKAGAYKVTVTLKNNFSGGNTKSFVITPRSITDAKIVLSKRTYTYSGKACKPEVTVTVGDTVLEKGTDYKVIYSSNKDAGTGKVQIEGIGNYKNKSKTLTFLIRKQAQKFKASPKAESFSVSYGKVKKAAQQLPVSKTLKITNPTGTVTYAMGYASGGKFTVDENTGAITVGKGTAKGTYTLTIRLCAEGDANHVRCYRLVDVVIKVK